MMDDLFETPAYKLVRRDDPSTSHDAAEQLDVNKMERVVLAAITSFAANGCILTMLRISRLSLQHNHCQIQTTKEKVDLTDHRKRKAESGRQQLIKWAKEFYVADEISNRNPKTKKSKKDVAESRLCTPKHFIRQKFGAAQGQDHLQQGYAMNNTSSTATVFSFYLKKTSSCIRWNKRAWL